MDQEKKCPTRAEYDAATPRQKGYMAYTYSCWPGSQIPSEEVGVCEFPRGSARRQQFLMGVQTGVLEAQDTEA